ALLPALAPVAQALEQRWPRGLAGGGRATVKLRGLKTAAQYLGFCRGAQRGVAGVANCHAARLARGEAWFTLTTALSARDLAAALARASFGSYRLELERVESGVISMRAKQGGSG
ncbi:MAG: hypothetical protein KC503_21490, partial [Myxococcales bacterium]|nr:hypothetical protein [Myxococcales bacterium]